MLFDVENIGQDEILTKSIFGGKDAKNGSC